MKKPYYCDNEFAPMANPNTPTPVRKGPSHATPHTTGGYPDEGEAPGHVEKTYAPNAYPDGSVPKETGWQSREGSISALPGHNAMTVCRNRHRSRGS